MTTRSKLLLTALIAACAMSFAVDTATALRSIEIGGRREVHYTARRLTFEGEGNNVECEVTLNATLNAAISKTTGSIAGAAEARFNEATCTGGRPRVLNIRGGFPIKYLSFTGTLPRISSIRLLLEEVAFLVEAFGGLGRCLYRGNLQMTTGPNETVTELTLDESVRLGLFRNEGISCPARIGFKGAFTGATVTLRLV